ncbi:hypothetical protein HaLaN_08224 [Haematococcus lacustris]|uniref:Uncharacterized protein n=1 Tax=Haematococcus lacustris TaxID=44745 RepID=A0A699YYK3_HAELA|nr:hypothetical protein HaLaN_08224 [Haematococcus lacustris]
MDHARRPVLRQLPETPLRLDDPAKRQRLAYQTPVHGTSALNVCTPGWETCSTDCLQCSPDPISPSLSCAQDTARSAAGRRRRHPRLPKGPRWQGMPSGAFLPVIPQHNLQ